MEPVGLEQHYILLRKFCDLPLQRDKGEIVKLQRAHG